VVGERQALGVAHHLAAQVEDDALVELRVDVLVDDREAVDERRDDEAGDDREARSS
jgi:hypothetical protein